MSSNNTVLSCHLIEPNKVSTVKVDHRIITYPIDESHYYNVFIDKENPYSIQYTAILLNSNEHDGYLNSQDNRVLCAIRARHLRKGSREPSIPEIIQIGIGDWDILKPRKVGTGSNDIHFDEAERIIGRLLYRIAKEPYNQEGTFNFSDLRASLDFENFEGILTSLKKRGHVSLYKDHQGRIIDDQWTVTDKGFEHFIQMINDMKEKTEPLTENPYFKTVKLTVENEDNKPFIFAILPFKKEKGFNQSFWKRGYEKVIPENCSMKCFRSDGDKGPPKIGDKIWTMMQKAEFIVVDVSSLNPNVLVELGMALALGKDVYLFSSKKLEQILFFDIKDFPVNRYLGLAGLQKKLAEVLPKK